MAPVAPRGVSWRIRLPRWVKPVIFTVCLIPFVYLVWAAFNDGLGANPAEALIRSTGDLVIRGLCLVLLMTPLRTYLQWSSALSLRRMLGLFTFFYAVLHAISYAAFDMDLDVAAIVTDVIDRPFITVGMAGFLLLLALAITSPHRVVKWMGASRWKRLHRAVYAVAVLAVLHFFWMRSGKQNFAEVWLYGILLTALMVARLPFFTRRVRRAH